MKSIKTIESRLKKKPLVENFGDKEIRELEDFIGDIYEYPYGTRLIVQDRIQDFCDWCANYVL